MFGSITGFLFITKHNKHAIALKLSTITAIAFILSRYGALLIIKNKNFTSENCIYWIKTKDFKNWKLAIYNAEKEEFRLITKLPERETIIIKKENVTSYIVNTNIDVDMP